MARWNRAVSILTGGQRYQSENHNAGMALVAVALEAVALEAVARQVAVRACL